MIIVKNIFEIHQMRQPQGITFGNFDGVHRGHLYLLKKLRDIVTEQGTLAVLTFSNQPLEVLKKNTSQTPICSLSEKIALLEKAGVDLLILLEFTHTLSEYSYKDFIEKIRKSYPFTHLLLGKGATFGRQREGDEEKVTQLGHQLGFEAHYIDKMEDGEEIISSGRIRNLLSQGKKHEAEVLLGRAIK